jgi:hypothetical protein
MCLILKQSIASQPLTPDEVRAIYRRNSDGFGVAWHDDTGVAQHWRRVPVDAADAVFLYDLAFRLATDRPVVMHWRMATSGHTVDDLAHPFSVPGGSLIHNGVLPDWAARARPGQSDTAALAEHVSAVVAGSGMTPAEVYTSTTFREWLEREVKGSAVVVVRDGGHIDHYGNPGLMHADRWLSNTYAGPASIYPTPARSVYSGWGGWATYDDGDDRRPSYDRRWTRTRAGGWQLDTASTPTRTSPTSDKPPADRVITSVVTASRKRGRLRAARGKASPADIWGPPDLTRRGTIYAGTIRGAGEYLAAFASASAGWFLLDDDVDVVRWGISEHIDTLRSADGLTVRVVDLPDDRIAIRVVDEWDRPRCEDKDAPDARDD